MTPPRTARGTHAAHVLSHFLSLALGLLLMLPAPASAQRGYSVEIDAEELFELNVRDDQLVMDLKLEPEEMAGRRFSVRGILGDNAQASYRSSAFTLRANFQNARQESVTLRVERKPYQIDIRHDTGYGSDSVNVQLRQFDNRQNGTDDTFVQLMIKLGDRPTLTREAPELRLLRRDNPLEVVKFLSPVFRDLGAPWVIGIDPGLARQVFADPASPDAIARELPALVKQLDADRPADRELAADRIRLLGPEGIAALRALDRARLTPQQTTAIDALADARDLLTRDQIDDFRKDRDFLVDCLYCDDEPLRASALKLLSAAAKTKLTLDTKIDPMKQTRAIESLRKEVAAPSAASKD